MNELAISLERLVDDVLPEKLEPLTGWKRAFIRWTLSIVLLGGAFMGLGLLLELINLFIAGFITLLIAGFPAFFAVISYLADWHERRARPRDRAALLAGEYQDLEIVITTIEGGIGAGGRSVDVRVKAKDGRLVVLPCLDNHVRAENIAKVLIEQMTPERRSKYEDDIFRKRLRG